MLDEKKSICCHDCGHMHPMGTSCPSPKLTGKRSCQRRSLKETGEEIKCKECGWHWKLVDGGKDPYLCKCGYDNTPTQKELHTIKNDGHDEYHQLRADVDEALKGLWANIRAKQARGEKPAQKGSGAFKKAKQAANRINVMDETDNFCTECLMEYLLEYEHKLEEAEYRGRKVSLGKPFLTPDGPKKRSVYVKNAKGNVVKVNFGDPNLKIKKNIPARRKSFRARHKCDTAKDRTSPRYWSCKHW